MGREVRYEVVPGRLDDATAWLTSAAAGTGAWTPSAATRQRPPRSTPDAEASVTAEGW